jgi:hypothetical protein
MISTFWKWMIAAGIAWTFIGGHLLARLWWARSVDTGGPCLTYPESEPGLTIRAGDFNTCDPIALSGDFFWHHFIQFTGWSYQLEATAFAHAWTMFAIGGITNAVLRISWVLTHEQPSEQPAEAN